MEFDLNSRKEMLTNYKDTIYVISEIMAQYFDDTTISENLDFITFIQDLVDIDEKGLHKNGQQAISLPLAVYLAILNTKAIFNFAESPIEQIFLNALNIISFPYPDINIIYTVNTGDVRDAKFIDTLETQKVILNLWKVFRSISKKNDVRAFFGLLNEEGIHSDYLDRIIGYILTEYLSKIYGVYFITLQPTIKDILVSGKTIRPDIYIWNPYYPHFKLIVECDGYKYHSDKLSFSRDRTRDRYLHMKGFKVLRFSGSDIFNNPGGMAEELYQYLIAQKSEVEHSFLKPR